MVNLRVQVFLFVVGHSDQLVMKIASLLLFLVLSETSEWMASVLEAIWESVCPEILRSLNVCKDSGSCGKVCG